MTQSQNTRPNHYQSFGSEYRVSIMEHDQTDIYSFTVWSHEDGEYLRDGRGVKWFSQRDARDLALEYAY